MTLSLRRSLATLRHVGLIRGMAGEAHRECFVTVCIVSASLIRVVTHKLYVKLVKHFMKDDTRAKETSGQSWLAVTRPRIADTSGPRSDSPSAPEPVDQLPDNHNGIACGDHRRVHAHTARNLLATLIRDSSLLAHGTGREGSWPRKKRNRRLVSSSTGAAVSLRAALLAIAIASRIARRKVASH